VYGERLKHKVRLGASDEVLTCDTFHWRVGGVGWEKTAGRKERSVRHCNAIGVS
jgi:hypothetical protein